MPDDPSSPPDTVLAATFFSDGSDAHETNIMHLLVLAETIQNVPDVVHSGTHVRLRLAATAGGGGCAQASSGTTRFASM